eukprot:g55604.t1
MDRPASEKNVVCHLATFMWVILSRATLAAKWQMGQLLVMRKKVESGFSEECPQQNPQSHMAPHLKFPIGLILILWGLANPVPATTQQEMCRLCTPRILCRFRRSRS